jgi:hypothetical protein
MEIAVIMEKSRFELIQAGKDPSRETLTVVKIEYIPLFMN